MAIVGAGFLNFLKCFLVLGRAIHICISKISYKRDWLLAHPIPSCLFPCNFENKGFKKQKFAVVRQGSGQGIHCVVASALSNFIPNRYSNSLDTSRRDS
jgi:hypothetical protein